MAIVRIPETDEQVQDFEAVVDRLLSLGIAYERWKPSRVIAEDATADDVLTAYGDEIERLKAQGGYVTADVIDVGPETPGLETMLDRFRREHWHDEDEVRFILRGRGVFHVRPQAPQAGPVIAIEVGPGDLLRVPRGTWHWFDLCAERSIRAIRLFQDPSGWTPHYTESSAERGFQPVCLGHTQVPLRA